MDFSCLNTWFYHGQFIISNHLFISGGVHVPSPSIPHYVQLSVVHLRSLHHSTDHVVSFFYLRHSQKEGFLVMHLCTLLFSSVQLHSGVHLFNVGWISGPQYREGHSARGTQELWTKACSDGREWDPAPTQPPAKQKVIDILRNTQHYIPINNRVTVLIDWLRTFTLIISRVVLLALSWRFPSLTEFSVNAP